MLEHAIYSVISPEGCAAILWKDVKFSENAAESLCLTAQDLKKLKVIDEIITEPLGGAHRNVKEICKKVKNEILRFLKTFKHISSTELIQHRKDKFLKIGSEYLEN